MFLISNTNARLIQYIGSLPKIYLIQYLLNECYICAVGPYQDFNVSYKTKKSFDDLIETYKKNIQYPYTSGYITYEEDLILKEIWKNYKELV
jgi:hypothetical protein